MRVVRDAPTSCASALEQAQREAGAAFGARRRLPREVHRAAPSTSRCRSSATRHGNLVHLFERDCSVQRRHQKVVEIAPRLNLDPTLRDAPLRRRRAARPGRRLRQRRHRRVPGRRRRGEFYFIEVNPRIQVEHTVTEMVTGIDLVKSQILRRRRATRCTSPEIGIADAGRRSARAASRSSAASPPKTRPTTSSPTTAGSPHYRSAGGFGIRLDGGTGFAGAVITPFYDSLLVKVTRLRPAVRRRLPPDGPRACASSASAA